VKRLAFLILVAACGGGSSAPKAAPAGPHSDADCAKVCDGCTYSAPRNRCVSERCATMGMCSSKTTYDDDEKAELAQGYASVSGSTFETVGSDEDCKLSAYCARSGDCAVVGDRCGPKTDADCAQSQFCADQGLCAIGPNGCVATADSCAK